MKKIKKSIIIVMLEYNMGDFLSCPDSIVTPYPPADKLCLSKKSQAERL